ncbi:hypothetical protein BC830DRAFT_1151232 [Chytriomyces sp. MP71]|nr:hypothetical protein BC830DRAFT_1151232 [Chytriomyces sp. MP71]
MNTTLTDYRYNSANTLSIFLKGMSVGIGVIPILLGLLLAPFFPSRTVAAALAIGIVTITVNSLSSSADISIWQDCNLRVKLLLSLLVVQTCVYAFFQANLTHLVCSMYPKIIPGTTSIIVCASSIRVGISISTVFLSDWKRAPNQLCSSVLLPDISLADRLAEVLFSSTLSILFIYPILMGYREISSVRDDTPNFAGSHNKIAADMHWFKQIMMDRGSILVLSCIVEAVYLACLFGTRDPSRVSLWNSAFSGDYAVLMSVHMLTTVRRKGVAALSRADGTGSPGVALSRAGTLSNVQRC